MSDHPVPSWSGKLSHPAQLGGIETAVLDNGPGRGTRIAWINTGSGLRYKVVIDRAMDIADASHNQYNLSWLSLSGITAPQPFSDRGAGWLRTFGGGLLTTCGLDHVGGPEVDEYGERGLHGPISNTAAEVESILQPDPRKGRMKMSITGLIRQTTIFGPSLELRRTISSTLGKSSIFIHDEVTNLSNQPTPHMLLYHCNFGWPLVDEGTRILWKGDLQQKPPGNPGNIFRPGHDYRRCPGPLEVHAGKGEDVGFIDSLADRNGQCSCGLYNERINLAFVLRFRKDQLPWLTNWQHFGYGEYITGLEPGTNPPIGQAAARKASTLRFVAPGESLVYDLEMEVLQGTESCHDFLGGFEAS